MNLRGVDLTEYLRKIGIREELDIAPYMRELLEKIKIKSRITKEMPKLILSSTPVRHRDILDTQVYALTGWHIYDEVDTFPSLEYQLENAKPKERRRIRRKMKKRNKLNQELNKHNRVILDDWIGIEDETGRKYAVQVNGVNGHG